MPSASWGWCGSATSIPAGELEADKALNDDYVALDLDPALSHGAAPWQNMIIEGDNYDALRALRMSHKGAIRCIYIDPLYNTGNRDFVYKDRFFSRKKGHACAAHY
jgi:adenine-specific DNA-methyltransferase